MTYAQQKTAAIGVTAVLAGLALLQAAPGDYGLTPVAAHWVGVLVAVLGVAAGFLPSVRGMSTDPAFLADRISELPPRKRETLATTMADRATRSAAVRQANEAVTDPLPPTPRYPRGG